MSNTFDWLGGAGNFGSASSWSLGSPGNVPGPPTAADDAEIDTTATMFGSGTAIQLNINAAVTISNPLTTTVGTYTIIGASAAGSVTLSSSWTNTSFLAVGNAIPGSLIIDAGGSVTNTGEIGVGQFAGGTGTVTIQGGGQLTVAGPYDVVGNTAGATGVVAISGTGSAWYVTGQVVFGNQGAGTIGISAGGSLRSAGPYDEIGQAAGGSGVVVIDGAGSNWTSTGVIVDGEQGTGSLTVSNDGRVDAVNLAVGNNNSGPTVNGGSGTALIESGGSVTTTGPYDEIGDFVGAAGAVTVDGAGSQWDAGGAIEIGDSGNGTLTISNDASVHAGAEFDVGQQSNSATNDGDSGALLIESGGTAVTGGFVNSTGSYDTVGLNAAGPTSTATVTGAGSSWTMSASLVVDTTGVVDVAAGGAIYAAGDIFLNQGSVISVDSTSVIASESTGGGLAGYLTVNPDPSGNSSLYGDGTVDANVMDDGKVFASDGGALTIDGSVLGSGVMFVGAQATLALNGADVSNSGGVKFLGWYGALDIANPSGFATPIQNFMPGDTIDLTGVTFDAANSSYSYDPSTDVLTITEGSSTVNLNVASSQFQAGSSPPLAGQLTLSQDAGGGTNIQFAAPPASPFQLWSTLSTNFFSTAAGPVDEDDWDQSNATGGGAPIWVDDETSAAGFAPGQPATYNIDLTSQDWLGDEQPLVPVATTTLINPFASLAAATIFTSNTSTGSGAVIYWQASATPGDYDLEFRPLSTTYVEAPSTGPNTVLTGPPVTMMNAVANPTGWSFTDNSTTLVFAYTTSVTATTEDIWFQAFNTSGVATSPLEEIVANVPDGTQYYVGYSNGTFYYRYTIINGAQTGLYGGTFDPTTGALGALGELVPLASFTAITGLGSRTLSNGNSLRLFEGIANGQNVIQAYLNDGASTPTATFNLTSPTDRFATANVADPNDGADDYTVVAYADNNQVHLELLNENGVQIGSDFIAPGLTSFDRIHTLTASAGFESSDTRVELDYTVADPNGGTQIEGLIFDTAGVADSYTLGAAGNNEYNGTPFNDTITDAPGNYVVDGGGGTDTFVANFSASQVSLGAAAGNVVITTPDGATTLRRFTTIDLLDETVSIPAMLAATLALTAPTAATVATGQQGAIAGVSLSESAAVIGESFTVTLTDAQGALSATGAGVSGSGTTSLTIAGSLAQVNADLATLTDTDGAPPADTITLNASDSFGNVAAAQTIAVAVDVPPVITAVTESPASGVLSAGELVTLTLSMSAAVMIAGGTPTLTLNDGGVATYDSAQSTATSLAFDYNGGLGDTDVASLAAVAVNPGGASIDDLAGYAADLSLAGLSQTGPSSGDTLTQFNSDGSAAISSFNITGLPYTDWVVTYGPNGSLLSQYFGGVTGLAYSSYEYYYDANGNLTQEVFNNNDGSQTIDGSAVPGTEGLAGATVDMLMRDSNTGALEIYDIANNTVASAASIGAVGLNWSIAGFGDFSGIADETDMLMRDSNSGMLEVYDIGQNKITSANAIGAVGLNWTVAGFGDFSGRFDESDMLMRDSNTGAFEVYDIGQNKITSAASMGGVGLNWKVVGFGDFSGNAGEADMLMRDGNTGMFEVYDISQNKITSASSMGGVGLNWTVVGFGDFSGNAGETDMLMRDRNTGAFEVYDISQNKITSAASMGGVGLNWTVVGFGDFSGAAGETDMLMRDSSSGMFEVYDINQNAVTSANSMGSVGLNWQVGGFGSEPPTSPPAASPTQLMQAMASFSPSSSSVLGGATSAPLTQQPNDLIAAPSHSM